MTNEKANKIVKILEGIDMSVSSSELEGLDTIDELQEYLEDNNYFDVEVIYYDSAMKYLTENDNSLGESIALAQDMGYQLENINSELLASLLASENMRNDYNELEDEIEEILDTE